MKLLLAGAENTTVAKNLWNVKAPYCLLSYYRLKEKDKVDLLKFIKSFRENGNKFLFLDSGAFSFFTQTGLVKHDRVQKVIELKRTDENPERYFQKYFNWLKQYGYLFDIFCELDVGRIVGTEKIREWREMFKKENMLDKLVVVWHNDETDFEDYENLCQEYKFVALPGRMKLQEYVSCLDVARKYKTKLHGFGLTKREILKRIPFFSVDSTSWLGGNLYGIISIFQGDKLIDIGNKQERRRYQNYIESLGLSFEKILQDDNNEVNKLNALTWIKYGQWIDEKQEKYWQETNQVSESLAQVKKSNLPVKDLGTIIEKVHRNPEAKKKWLERMRGNLFAFKTGKYLNKIPLYCNKCYAKGRCQFYQEPREESDLVLCQRQEIFRLVPTEFDYREKGKVCEVANKMINAFLDRIDNNLWFEILDGGVQDKALTSMMSQTLTLLVALAKIEEPSIQINLNKQIANVINFLDEDSRTKIITILEREVERSGCERDIIPSGT